ncbi:methyltransferase domain-containing protein [Candidatus Woesearchaeota archaeon]|nr:methyltransferase domain-containing protein [Candidatus Woesearchaeota archaeon]
MLFDSYSEEDVEKIVKEIQASSGNFRKFMKLKFGEELVSIARARMRAKSKTHYADLYFSEEDLRFATPDMVAEYRAGRLQCDTIVDVGCSVGFQSFAFSMHCKKVYAVEIDPRKIEYARRNARKLGIKNIEFIEGDALDFEVIAKIKEADIVFVDTERLPSEQKRSLSTLSPDIFEVMKKYAQLTGNFCFEIPPQIGFVDVPGEREYVDIGRKLNRLHLYCGGLMKVMVSLVSLPSGKRISGKANYELVEGAMEKYVGVLSPAVVKAGLVNPVCKELNALVFDPSKIFLISSPEMNDSVFVEWFGVVDTATNLKDLKEKLKKHAAGKVVIRFSVPSEKYWKTRALLEKALSGKDTVHIFKKEMFILEKNL